MNKKQNRKHFKKGLAWLSVFLLVISLFSAMAYPVSSRAEESDVALPEEAVVENTEDAAIPEEPAAVEEAAAPAEEAVSEPAADDAAPAEETVPAKAETPVQTQAVKSYTKELPNVIVRAKAGDKAFAEDVDLFIREIQSGTAAYQAAEKALTDKKYDFDGLLVFDIGFRSKATGKEVEPKGAVTVNLELKEKGFDELTIEDIDNASLTVAHIDDNKKVETVADKAPSTGTVEADKDTLKAEFAVDSFSTFTITWQNGEDEETATIHWGTHDEGGEWQEFDSTTTVDTSAASVDLNVAVDGYYFVSVAYKETEEAEEQELSSSVLKKDGDVYKIGDTTIANGSDVYVAYASKGDGSYTPPPKPTGDVLAPETNKTVTDNGDGTFTIQLDIEGKQDQEITQVGANVIVVMDITQSMTNNMPGGTRMAVAKSALNTLITALDPGTNLINFTAVNFGNSGDYYNGVGWTQSRTAMENYVSGLPNNPSDLGTCWQAGLQGGRDRVGTAPAGNETYVIFVTDGNPNGYVNAQGRYTQSGGAGFSQAAYNAAVPNANWLGANSHFYGIFVGDAEGYEHLEDLIEGANGEDVVNGSSSTEVENAFAQIAQTIIENLGAGNTVVDDGLPTLSNVSANVSAGDAGGFEYYITEPGGSMQEWEDAPGASYDKSNGVTWDLGEAGVLQNGTIYTLKFTVWPSQAAYDLIADLNNGVIDFDDLTEEQQASIDGSKEAGYTLKTNTHLYTTFTDLEGNEYMEENDARAKAMNLPTPTINVEKVWNNVLDQRTQTTAIKLTLERAGETYLEDIEVGPSTGWVSEDLYISCGQIRSTDDGYEILETGHDYELVEPEEIEESHRWEFTSEIYHPMVIDGDPVVLIKDEDATGTDGEDYYTIDGVKYVVAEDGENTLKGYNDRRSWLQIEKFLEAEDESVPAPEDELFEFTATLTSPDEEDIWYSAYGPDGIIKDLDTSGTPEEGNTGYFYVASGTPVTVKIKAGWTLRFINLLSGTEYEIEETGLPEGFAFDDADYRIVDDTDQSVEHDDPEAPDTGLTTTGTINVPNIEFYVDYTNKYAVTTAEFTKIWEDSDDVDGLRVAAEDFGGNISFFVNGEATTDYDTDDYRTITDNGDGTYTITYENLPKYIDGEEAEYTLQETSVPEGYEVDPTSAVADGEEFTNTHEPATTTVTVTKEWDDEDFFVDGEPVEGYERPESVTVTLLADGETADVDDAEVELSEDNEWTYTWEDLPVNGADGEIAYSVDEVDVTGYDVEMSDVSGDAESGYEVTITNTPKTIEIEVEKVWENADGSTTWPDGVTVDIQLTADGEAVEGKTATLSADQTSYTFTDLPQYDGETEIEYGVEEVEVTGFTSEVGDLTDGKITITNTQDTVDIEVEKVWENADGTTTWPDGVTVDIQLTADGEAVEGKTATLSADQTSYTFTDLPQYDGETEIEYGVEEVEVTGYTSEVGDLTDGKITITNTQDTVDIEVEKVWENADGTTTWPDGVTVDIQLTADGEAVEGKTATLSADQTSYTFTDLPQYDGETEIEYGVEEVEVTGYTSEVGDLTDGKITITNTQITTTVTVNKVWDDNDDAQGKRPESIEVTLLANGDPADIDDATVTLSDDNDWTYTWEGLKAFEDGAEIEYSVDEVEVEDYTTEIGDTQGSIEDGYTIEITNTVDEPETIDINGKKTWDDKNDKDKIRPTSITVRLLADGTEVSSIKVTKDSGWVYSFTGLPKTNDEGKEIVYTVKEDEVKGYKATYNGYNITNKHTPEKKKKTGDDNNMGLWAALMAAAAVSAGGVLAVRRRKKSQ